MSKVKIALGAASLFLFIVGMKRTLGSDGASDSETPSTAEDARDPTLSTPRAAARDIPI